MKTTSVVIDVRAGTTTLGVGRNTVTFAMDGMTIDKPLIHSLKGLELVVPGSDTGLTLPGGSSPWIVDSFVQVEHNTTRIP